MPTVYIDYLHWIAVVLGIGVSAAGALHALFSKRDPRSAFAWVAVCLMWPVVGSVIYVLFGKNRIATKARRLHGSVPIDQAARFAATPVAAMLDLGVEAHYLSLAHLSEVISRRPLLANNAVQPLSNGEEAYPAMIEAIDGARHCVYLASYIFERGGIGRQFVEALARAVERGVAVRVLVDGVGVHYSVPSVLWSLRRHRIPSARYLPPTLLPPSLTINLRNHRKLLLVDGRQAFTGGMNIRSGHLVDSASPSKAVVDLHFRVRGPIVEQLEEVFIADWRFASRISIDSYAWHRQPVRTDPMTACCRVIEDGPNEDLDKLMRVLVGAIAVARERICVMTPYFLPSRELELTLQSAALRGVVVEIIMPERNNLPFVKWASYHGIGELLAAGVRVHLYPRLFNHTKLLVIDDYYVQIGSANVDIRSLRLNFEITVEVYDRRFGSAMVAHFESSRQQCRALTPEMLRRRSAPAKLVSAVCWLLSPYL